MSISRGLIAILGLLFIMQFSASKPRVINEDTLDLEVQAYIVEMSSSCVTNDMTFGEILSLVHDDFADTQIKCFLACIMKNMGVMDMHGHFSEDGASRLVAKIPFGQTANKERLADAIISQCGGYSSPDDCQTAFEINQCLREHYQQFKKIFVSDDWFLEYIVF